MTSEALGGQLQLCFTARARPKLETRKTSNLVRDSIPGMNNWWSDIELKGKKSRSLGTKTWKSSRTLIFIESGSICVKSNVNNILPHIHFNSSMLYSYRLSTERERYIYINVWISSFAWKMKLVASLCCRHSAPDHDHSEFLNASDCNDNDHFILKMQKTCICKIYQPRG